MINYLRLEPNTNIMFQLYKNHFETNIKKMIKKYEFEYSTNTDIKLQKINSVEKLKLENLNKNIDDCKNKIFEYYLLYITEKVMSYFYKDNTAKFHKYYYTLHHLMKLKITHLNDYVVNFIDAVLADYYVELSIEQMFLQSSDLIEKNEFIAKYKDYQLYEHQKQLFTISKNPNPKLVLYIAPTGTGKTLSPIGLSESHKIIFVCAARHVGLALAKSAISMGKKIAFAFGCNDVSDIRLHYFAGKEYVKHSKTGQDIKYKDGSKKIDNSVGDNVEIMICDIKSYLCAMYYMNAFHKKEEMIMYWDEPTITMDYDNHEFHNYISDIWQKNIVPNIILSSATLPHEEDLQETICDFNSRFENGRVYNIVSHDCNKSIPLLNVLGEVEMPHLKYESYNDLQKSITHCLKYKTLLRYFDLSSIVQFVYYLNKNNIINSNKTQIKERYEDLTELTMNNIKLHYLDILQEIPEDKWDHIYKYFQDIRTKKYNSTVNIATSDAHTLTDGPAIYLAEDVEKISKFILQSIKIPEQVIKDMMESIEYNDKILKILKQKEKDLEDSIGEEAEKEHKMIKEALSPEF